MIVTNIWQKLSSFEHRKTLIVRNIWQLFSHIIGETLLIVTNIWRNPTSFCEWVNSRYPRPLHTVNPLAPGSSIGVNDGRVRSLKVSLPSEPASPVPHSHSTGPIRDSFVRRYTGSSFPRRLCQGLANHSIGRHLYAPQTRQVRRASDSRGRLVYVREYIVKIRELWKRFTCYHCLRKEHAFVSESGRTRRIRSKRRR